MAVWILTRTKNITPCIRDKEDNGEEPGMRKKQICLFIDTEKAIVRVLRKLFWKVMSEQPSSVVKKIIWVIKNIYSNTVSKVMKGDVELD